MNLNESVRQWVIGALPYDRANAQLVTHLNGLDARRLLIVYHNWMSRLIKPAARSVRKSKAFAKNPIVAGHAGNFAAIINDIENGRDLRRYLSRGVEVAAEVPGKDFGRRRDLDLMLNDWGVHHLHISTEVEADGYVKRDGPLLFAIFRPKTAYLIDVMGHRDWTRDHIMEVLVDEWPDEGIIHQIKGSQGLEVIGLARKYSEEERAKLRKKGINALLEVRGRVFMPAGGMTAAGTTIEASRAADRLLGDLGMFEEAFQNHPERLKTIFKSAGIIFPEKPEFEFIITEDGYGVIETRTGSFINLMRP
jgi:hypothetical protein